MGQELAPREARVRPREDPRRRRQARFVPLKLALVLGNAGIVARVGDTNVSEDRAADFFFVVVVVADLVEGRRQAILARNLSKKDVLAIGRYQPAPFDVLGAVAARNFR